MTDQEQYDADHLRRIARSLSGTAVGRREDHLAVSQSFVCIYANIEMHHPYVYLSVRMTCLLWHCPITILFTQAAAYLVINI